MGGPWSKGKRRLKDRFWEKITYEDDHWIFGNPESKQRGRIFDGRDKSPRLASHVSLELHGIEIPEGKQVNHLCNNERCVNPDHLYVGTQRQNLVDDLFDKIGHHNAKKTHCLRGHEYTTDNIQVQYYYKNGVRLDRTGRRCKQCERDKYKQMREAFIKSRK